MGQRKSTNFFLRRRRPKRSIPSSRDDGANFYLRSFRFSRPPLRVARKHGATDNVALLLRYDATGWSEDEDTF